jgi:hypothetical protein
MKKILFAAVSLSLLSGIAYAENVIIKNERKTVEEKLKKFCSGNRKEIKERENKHFRKAEVDPGVQGLGTGAHKQENGTAITIYEGSVYLVQFPAGHMTRRTSYDDFVDTTSTIGGCSMEQLSELLKNNNVKIEQKTE